MPSDCYRSSKGNQYGIIQNAFDAANEAVEFDLRMAARTNAAPQPNGKLCRAFQRAKWKRPHLGAAGGNRPTSHAPA